MADINALLAQGIALPQLQNPVNQFAQLQALRSAQQEQQLNALKLREAQTTMGQQEELRNYLAGATDYTAPEFTAGLTKFGTPGLAVAKGLSEQATAELTRQKTKSELTKAQAELVSTKTAQARQMLEGINPNDPNAPQLYNQWLEAVHQDDVLGPTFDSYGATLASSKARLQAALSQPGGFANLLNESKMGADKFATHMQQQATLAETQRHNKATENVAKARFEAEKEKGNFSPETIDYLAEIFKQTGTLPPLGLGASETRMKIFERARQTGTAPGAGGVEGVAPTAAEAAGSVAAAKQTKAAEQAAVKAFSSGLEARRVTANNTAINHLETMDKLSDALANTSDVRAFNAAANLFSKETGATAPTNFNAARQIVAAEVIKAVVQNGGGVTERQEAAKAFNAANTPEQLKGVINTYRDLLGGQLQSLKQQYESGTNRTDFDKKLSPNTRKLLTPAAAAPAAGTAPNIQSLLDKYK